jgi:hypothetical protein
MTDAMEVFSAALNILNLEMRLQMETHLDGRRILLQLLANEVAKHPEAVQRAHAMAISAVT